MKKIFKVEDLDCANCAAKMENAIKKIDGVTSANLSFLTQKLTIEANEECFDELIKKVEKICKKIEHDFKIIF